MCIYIYIVLENMVFHMEKPGWHISWGISIGLTTLGL